MYAIERSDFDALFDALARRGYTITSPTVRDRAIVYDEIRASADLPIGWTDEQDAGLGLSDEVRSVVAELTATVLNEAQALAT